MRMMEDNYDIPLKVEKKPDPQYMIFWKKGGHVYSYGPVRDKRVAERDANHYKRTEEDGWMEVYSPSKHDKTDRRWR